MCLEILFVDHRGQSSDDPGTVFCSDMYYARSLPTAPAPDFAMAFRAWEPLDDSVSMKFGANCSTNKLRDGDRNLG